MPGQSHTVPVFARLAFAPKSRSTAAGPMSCSTKARSSARDPAGAADCGAARGSAAPASSKRQKRSKAAKDWIPILTRLPPLVSVLRPEPFSEAEVQAHARAAGRHLRHLRAGLSPRVIVVKRARARSAPAPAPAVRKPRAAEREALTPSERLPGHGDCLPRRGRAAHDGHRPGLRMGCGFGGGSADAASPLGSGPATAAPGPNSEYSLPTA